MWRSFFAWLGFVPAPPETGRRGAHSHALHGVQAHGHTHGTVDPSIVTTARGIWAIKWSFVVLAITSLLQFAVVIASGSVALLADTIHNVGDALTAVPLWIAFRLARRKASERFTYGYGRVEDFAGATIVLIILISALVAGYEAIDRLLRPQPIAMLGWVAAAYLRLSPRTLEKQRVIGGGPRFRKFGRRVLYAIEDLETWAKARACEMTSDPNYGAR